MSGGIPEWEDLGIGGPVDEAPADEPAEQSTSTAASGAPELVFGNVDEFLRMKLRYLYPRRVGPQGQYRWAADWWKYPEAISRLDALWRAWEALRLDGQFGMSVWWRDHADHHMRYLLDADGPFAGSQDRNDETDGYALPYSAPPDGMFLDARLLPE